MREPRFKPGDREGAVFCSLEFHAFAAPEVVNRMTDAVIDAWIKCIEEEPNG